MKLNKSLSVVSIALAFGTASYATQFKVRDLGPASSAVTGALHVNNHGLVVGYAPFSQGGACEWAPNASTPSNMAGFTNTSIAWSSNESMQVVGRYGDPFGSGSTLAFFWDPTTGLRELPPLSANTCAEAYAVNEAGTAAGVSANYSGDPNSHAVIWQNGAAIDLGTLQGGGTYYNAATINAYGQVAGGMSSGSTNQAILWTPEVINGSTGQMVSLGSLGGTSTGASAINDFGCVTGSSQIANGTIHAFMWVPAQHNGQTGSMYDISSHAAGNVYGDAINDKEEIVGNQITSAGRYAFLYTPATGMVNLNSVIPTGTGWSLMVAYSINDRGQIVGWGSLNGSYHSFLLTPIDDYDNAG